MPVFKVCLKIIKKNLPFIMLYVVIFLVISVLITNSSVSQQAKGFTPSKAKIAFFAEESTPLVEGFKKELAKTADLVDLPDETEKLQDALFFRNITYILRVPAGFTADFLQGKERPLKKTVVPDTIENAYVDLAVNQYWHLAGLYSKQVPSITQEETVQRIAADMAVDTPVRVSIADGRPDVSQGFLVYYFNFLGYTLTSVLILGVSSIMIVFNNKDLTRRIFCSPVSSSSIHSQIFLSILVFTTAAWLLMTGACFILAGKETLNENMLYLMLNSLVFSLCLASISFLIGNLVKSSNAVNAVANLVALGPSFISGAFVPQELLAAPVLRLASFTPTFWYIQANIKIGGLSDFTWPHLAPVYRNMLIEFGFALAFFAIALVVGKRNRQQA